MHWRDGSKVRLGLLAFGAALAAAALVVLADLALYLALLGPADGLRRIRFEVSGVLAARAMETGAISPEAAFARLHGFPHPP